MGDCVKWRLTILAPCSASTEQFLFQNKVFKLPLGPVFAVFYCFLRHMITVTVNGQELVEMIVHYH